MRVHPEPLSDVTRYIEGHKHIMLEGNDEQRLHAWAAELASAAVQDCGSVSA